jgi:hypothetical protein
MLMMLLLMLMMLPMALVTEIDGRGRRVRFEWQKIHFFSRLFFLFVDPALSLASQLAKVSGSKTILLLLAVGRTLVEITLEHGVQFEVWQRRTSPGCELRPTAASVRLRRRRSGLGGFLSTRRGLRRFYVVDVVAVMRPTLGSVVQERRRKTSSDVKPAKKVAKMRMAQFLCTRSLFSTRFNGKMIELID